MIRVYTDHPELLNDLGEVIRLYLPMEEVVPPKTARLPPLFRPYWRRTAIRGALSALSIWMGRGQSTSIFIRTWAAAS